MRGTKGAHLDDVGVGEHLVEQVQLPAELQAVDDVVLLPGGDLHQAGEAQEAPVGVVLDGGTGRQGVGDGGGRVELHAAVSDWRGSSSEVTESI